MIKTTCLLAVLASILASGNLQLLQASEKYYVSSVILEYVQAYAVCRRNGLTLLTEKSDEESDNINAAISTAGVGNRYHWLGGLNVTQGELEPAWVWLETNELLNYTKWQTGQPTSGYNCLMRFALEDTPPGEWGSRPCSTPLWFICQTP